MFLCSDGKRREKQDSLAVKRKLSPLYAGTGPRETGYRVSEWKSWLLLPSGHGAKITLSTIGQIKSNVFLKNQVPKMISQREK